MGWGGGGIEVSLGIGIADGVEGGVGRGGSGRGVGIMSEGQLEECGGGVGAVGGGWVGVGVEWGINGCR